MKYQPNLFEKAIICRAPLLNKGNAVRLVNGSGDHLSGLLIDLYNQHVQIQVLEQEWLEQMHLIQEFLSKKMPVSYMIMKYRQGLDIKTQVLLGEDPTTVVTEHGIKFGINLDEHLNCGLFLDMRHNRLMVAQACKNKKVLNCFAYTCSFGTYARIFEAKEVVNIDISRKILERGQKNYQLNNIAVNEADFIKADVMSYLQRAFKKGNTFDVIVLDPPSFARHEGKVFQIKRDLPKLMALAVAVLRPGGQMLVTSNFSEITHNDLERILAFGLNGRQVHGLKRVGQDLDFRGTNTFKESHLVGLWVKFS